MQGYRLEHDLLGERQVPEGVYYGIHTLRALENFDISGVRLCHFPALIRALAYVKKASALANFRFGRLESEKAESIVQTCDEIIEGKFHDQFVVDLIQGGAGTSINMNVNEVIANRALERLGHRRGEYRYLHPLDHVNRSQSTNDVVPSALRLALRFEVEKLGSALSELIEELHRKADEFEKVYKIGRTENQDAVPMTLGQEFRAYAVMMEEGKRRLEAAADSLLCLNLGGTAIGTGINTVPGYAETVVQILADLTRLPLRRARDPVEATQDASELAVLSSALKNVAVQLAKMSRDLRWLSSGPRSGLNEICLPAVQAGSSIMPGKVNPVMPEMLEQVSLRVMASDLTVTLAAERGELQLNAFLPLIAFELHQSIGWLTRALQAFASKCVAGIRANEDRLRQYVETSLSLAAALVPVLGYEKATEVAQKAHQEGRTIREVVLAEKLLTEDEVDDLLNPEQLVGRLRATSHSNCR
ncbi:MAG: aspartate ammonia-lyase [Hydrogenibacillus schlegelii]|uniref:aspartate ammonia-lyase n=1 Tax=Hydrogenibacillus schlegelii TaxID=1484 RepID=A0A947GHE1_HYDSH|nr:aspartate ammonia-lyase [Hydrogenibacillus schlegelii]